MVPILDGNSGIGAHVKNNLCYLICLRCSNKIEISHTLDLFFSCATCSKLPSNISTMIKTDARVPDPVSEESGSEPLEKKRFSDPNCFLYYKIQTILKNKNGIRFH